MSTAIARSVDNSGSWSLSTSSEPPLWLSLGAVVGLTSSLKVSFKAMERMQALDKETKFWVLGNVSHTVSSFRNAGTRNLPYTR